MRQRQRFHASRVLAAVVFWLTPTTLVALAWSASVTFMENPNPPYPAVGVTVTALMDGAATLAALPGFIMSLIILGPVWYRSARRLYFLSGVLGVASGPFSVVLIFATDAEGPFILYPSLIALILATPLFLILRGTGLLSPLPPSTSCSYCGYDLRGASGDVCPECGARG